MAATAGALLWLLLEFRLMAIARAATPSPAAQTVLQPCEKLDSLQLDRKLRDEGDFDSRFMASTLEEAVDRFDDLRSTHFLKKAEQYTCDSQCALRTEQIRSTFAKYGQLPSPSVPINTAPSGPSFADIRHALEARMLAGPAPLANTQWSAPLFPDFGVLGFGDKSTSATSAGGGGFRDPLPGTQAGAVPSGDTFRDDQWRTRSSGPNDDLGFMQQNNPSRQQQQLQQPLVTPAPIFPPIPINAGFPMVPAGLAAPQPVSTDDSDLADGVEGRSFLSDLRMSNKEFKARRRNKAQIMSPLVTPPAIDSSWRGVQPFAIGQRNKRQSSNNSTGIGQSYQIDCNKKGDEEQPNLRSLCGSCRAIRELPKDYYPRFLNEVLCSGQTCFDKASEGAGRCAQQFLDFSILRNVGTEDCPKWTSYTIAVPVCCTCLMSNALAQYLGMPWSGQTITTSVPKIKN